MRGSEPSIELTDYRDGGRAEVRLYTVRGGGHVIPNRHRGPAIMGSTTQEIDAPRVIADFFGLV
jgi:polyhydroxybutyrate depolymerase